MILKLNLQIVITKSISMLFCSFCSTFLEHRSQSNIGKYLLDTHLVFFFLTPLSFFFFSLFLLGVLWVLPISVELKFCDCNITTSSFFLFEPLELLLTFSRLGWNMPRSWWCIGEPSSFWGEPLYSRGDPILPNMSCCCCSPSITWMECTLMLSWFLLSKVDDREGKGWLL